MRLRALTGGNLTGVTTFGTDLGLRRPDDHPSLSDLGLHGPLMTIQSP
jgi:hypothetical protein